MNTVIEDDLATWLKRWFAHRSPAIVVVSPSGERVPTGENWVPTEDSTVLQRVIDACARALANSTSKESPSQDEQISTR